MKKIAIISIILTMIFILAGTGFAKVTTQFSNCLISFPFLYYPIEFCTGSYYCNLKMPNGWNLISLPLQINENTNMDHLSFSTVYKLTEKGYTRINQSSMQFGKGYWVFTDNNIHYLLGGEKDSCQPELKDGWNLIGIGSSKVKNTYPLIYEFDQNKGYIRLGPDAWLIPGNGYWVYKK